MSELNKIVILGGGTSGWFTAAVLAFQYKNSNLKIELIESNQIGIIGVGEATIPHFISALKSIEIDEIDFIKSTQSTFKLAIQFSNWRNMDHSYIHPFGQVGQDFHYQNFYQCFNKMRNMGSRHQYMDYSPNAHMMNSNKFLFPYQAKNTAVEASAYALHIDAKLAADYFRKYAEKLGVKRKEGLVKHVELDDDGFVESLSLEDGSNILGDFFFDCSGFRSVIIGEALGVQFEDWSKYLTVNKAVTIQTERIPDYYQNYTESTALEYGWSWRIPLQTRTGNGYVFDSQYCSADEAKAKLLQTIKSKPVNDPQLIHFKTGIMETPWKKNCIGIGLASGFLEPLESTAINMVTRGIQQFTKMIPTDSRDETFISEYNRRMRMEYEEIRDFLIIHYCTTDRIDTPFWEYYRSMNLPASLQHQLALYKERGLVINGEDDLFNNDSWYAVLEGMGMTPKSHDPLLDNLDFSKIVNLVNQIPTAINKTVDNLPSHHQFINKVCKTNI